MYALSKLIHQRVCFYSTNGPVNVKVLRPPPCFLYTFYTEVLPPAWVISVWSHHEFANRCLTAKGPQVHVTVIAIPPTNQNKALTKCHTMQMFVNYIT